MPNRTRQIPYLIAFLVILAFAQTLFAQTSGVPPSPSADTAGRLAKLEQQAADAKGSADNAWMLVSSALVLMMTGPDWPSSTAGLCVRKTSWPP